MKYDITAIYIYSNTSFYSVYLILLTLMQLRCHRIPSYKVLQQRLLQDPDYAVKRVLRLELVFSQPRLLTVSTVQYIEPNLKGQNEQIKL